MECGRFETDNNKELLDDMFKIPILMNDMFNSIAKLASYLMN